MFRYGCKSMCVDFMPMPMLMLMLNLAIGQIFAPVAQLEELLRPKEKVGGSIPPGGSLRV